MERVSLYCRGVYCAEAVLQEAEGRVAISAEIEDPRDGLYRAVLQGERGELSLGVLEPREGKLVLQRRPERCEIVRLGALRCVQVICAFPFRKKTAWSETTQPWQLLRGDFFRSRLESVSRARWRKAPDRLLLALPLKIGEPFPLETIFCFARVEQVDGELCVVYAFDENEEPIYA